MPGINILAGGAGIDSYVVQNTGDQVVEQANEGVDYVTSRATFTLGDHVEHLKLTGVGDINGTGNGSGKYHHRQCRRQCPRWWGRRDKLSGGAGDDTFIIDSLP